MTDDLDASVSPHPSGPLQPLPGRDSLRFDDTPQPAVVASRGWWVAIAALGLLSVVSLGLAWRAEQRGASLEQELVRRQQESAGQAAEARVLAKQAGEVAGEAAAKMALLEARVAETSMQRTQLEELMQSLSRSRDESVLADVEASLRAALQQTAITGSAEPLVATLKQSDERLVNLGQPRLDGVRRAIARDLERIKAVSVADVGSLGIKLDETIRLIDDVPLLASPGAPPDSARRGGTGMPVSRAAPSNVALAASVAALSASSAPSAVAPTVSGWADWTDRIAQLWRAVGERVWSEAKSLVRVTRIDHPEAMLLAPEQSFFIRENVKLRLLNARLALLSRQYDTAQSDLQVALTSLDRYFDRSAKRTLVASELIRQVLGQARQVGVPRPDDTLAALAAASGGR